MTKCLTLLFVFLATSAAVLAAENWRIDIFDKAQALVAAKNHKFMALLVEAEPRLAEWCKRAAAREEVKQKATRFAFVKLLREKPEEITSDKPADWVRILDTLRSPAATLLRADPAFEKIFSEYEAKRKGSGSMNPPSELYEPIREKLATESTLQIEVEMYRSLDGLAEEVAKKKASHTSEPTAASGRGSP